MKCTFLAYISRTDIWTKTSELPPVLKKTCYGSNIAQNLKLDQCWYFQLGCLTFIRMKSVIKMNKQMRLTNKNISAFLDIQIRPQSMNLMHKCVSFRHLNTRLGHVSDYKQCLQSLFTKSNHVLLLFEIPYLPVGMIFLNDISSMSVRFRLK